MRLTTYFKKLPLLAFIITVVTCLPSQSLPQSLPMTSYAIENISNSRITIYLSDDSKTWRKDDINPREVTEFSCKLPYIKVITNSNPVKVSQYRLDCSERYSLRWNNSKRKWDFFQF